MRPSNQMRTRFIVLAFLLQSKQTVAFAPPHRAVGTRQSSRAFQSVTNGDDNNYSDETIPNGNNKSSKDINNDHDNVLVRFGEDDVATDDDFVVVAPTALYSEDPNDHRYSASDWWANVKSLPRSTILRAVQGPVVTVMVWSFFVSLLHMTFRVVGKATWAQKMCISSKPHSFLVSALGLLLVFRTNSSYQRFAEGRKIWEHILSISRNISRLTTLYEPDMGGERKHRIFRLLGAFPYLLHHHIQPQCLTTTERQNLKGTNFAIELHDTTACDNGVGGVLNQGNFVRHIRQQIQDRRVFRFGAKRKTTEKQQSSSTSSPSPSQQQQLDVLDEECELNCVVDRRALPWCLLPPSALRKCADSGNRPLWVTDRLSQEVCQVPYSDTFTSRERLAFLSSIDKLSKCIGACERIHQTAVPLNYARHSLRSLTIWLFSLPFTLVNEFGILTAPVMGVISWVLFGVYQIGCAIEDPFQGSLRLSSLCDAIYRDVMYDTVNLRNKRDSAFHLEPEIQEWNRLGAVPLNVDREASDDSISSQSVSIQLDTTPTRPQSTTKATKGEDEELYFPPPQTTSPSYAEDDPLRPMP